MSVTVTWRNKDRLARKLKLLAPTALKELTVANGKSAEEMVSTAQSFAPRRTGKLAESIVATPPGAIPPAYSQGKSTVDTGAYLVTAGNTKVRYAHLVEFGTRPHPQGGMFKGTEHPGTKPRPFFFTAFRLMARRHKGRASRAISKSIKAVALK